MVELLYVGLVVCRDACDKKLDLSGCETRETPDFMPLEYFEGQDAPSCMCLKCA